MSALPFAVFTILLFFHYIQTRYICTNPEFFSWKLKFNYCNNITWKCYHLFHHVITWCGSHHFDCLAAILLQTKKQTCHMSPYKAWHSALMIGWFSTAVISAFCSFLFWGVVTSRVHCCVAPLLLWWHLETNSNTLILLIILILLTLVFTTMNSQNLF